MNKQEHKLESDIMETQHHPSLRFLVLGLIALLCSLSTAQAATVYTEDFEAGAAGWSMDNGVWEIGTPSAGPAACAGGSAQCAGTVLDGKYPPEADSRLISSGLVLPLVTGTAEIHLRFWQWFSYAIADSGVAEGGYVQISVWDEASGAWTPWTSVSDLIDRV
ncbi:MAG TPA: hypothetical protein ENJ19_04115, partial [Gammaproteobacteria bacterium]|nr:hypothetical protein [Gammaproteobacteria bacterium]